MVAADEKNRTAFFERRKQFLQIKKMMFATAVKVAKIAEPNPHDLAKFNLLGRHIVPVMRADIIRRAERLKVKTVIDNALVDQAIEQILQKKKQSSKDESVVS